MNRNCYLCGIGFIVPKYHPNAKFCSKKCRISGNGKLSAKKRGDIQRGRGMGKSYRKLYGRHEHRVVAEQKIGRKLLKNEVVHHINGDKLDNRPDNLIVITLSKHTAHHATKNRICSIKDCKLKHHSKNLCHRHYRQMLRVGKILN